MRCLTLRSNATSDALCPNCFAKRYSLPAASSNQTKASPHIPVAKPLRALTARKRRSVDRKGGDILRILKIFQFDLIRLPGQKSAIPNLSAHEGIFRVLEVLRPCEGIR